jgi:hypothetical protein
MLSLDALFSNFTVQSCIPVTEHGKKIKCIKNFDGETSFKAVILKSKDMGG